MPNETAEYIDLTPTWAGLIPAMVAVLANPEAEYKAKRNIQEQLTRLATAVDKMNAAKKEGGDSN